MTDRTEFEKARRIGLERRQEQRLDRATYTAAEVRVLTDAALLLGRREALTEIAAWADDLAAGVINRDKPYNQGFIHAGETLARHAREIGSKEATPDPPKCKRCRGLGYVPDFTNWDEYHGEPKPKPCPDCGTKEAS